MIRRSLIRGHTHTHTYIHIHTHTHTLHIFRLKKPIKEPFLLKALSSQEALTVTASGRHILSVFQVDTFLVSSFEKKKPTPHSLLDPYTSLRFVVCLYEESDPYPRHTTSACFLPLILRIDLKSDCLDFKFKSLLYSLSAPSAIIENPPLIPIIIGPGIK